MVILMYAAANCVAFAFDGVYMETRSEWLCQGALCKLYKHITNAN